MEKSSEELSSHALRTRFPESAREVGSAKGAPDSRSIGICAARSCCGIHGQGGGPRPRLDKQGGGPRLPAAPCPYRPVTADSFFLFSCRRSGYCLLSSELRPFCLLLTAALADDCTSLYNPERLFRAHKGCNSVSVTVSIIINVVLC